MKFSCTLLFSVLASVPALLPAQSATNGETAPNKELVKLDPYVVTAAQSRQPLIVETDPRAPAQPVPAHDGADALKNIPGFSVIRKGGTDGDPVLRGLAGSRLGIQIDGECLFGGCGNRMDPPTAYVFPGAYDRITVIKGPQTVLHGPGYAAGVVLFERDTQSSASPFMALLASATAASFGRLDALLDARTGNSLLQVRGTGTHTQTEDYEDGKGQAVHSEYRRWSSNAALAWTPDTQTLIELSGARSDGEAAYADRAMDGVAFDRSNYGLRLLRENISPSIRSLEARWYHNYVDHVMDNFTLRPFVASMMMPNRSVSNPDRLTEGGLAQTTLSPADFIAITAGVDTQKNQHTLRSTGNQATSPYEAKARVEDANFSQYGFFSEGTWSIDSGKRLVAGARLDNWKAQDSRAAVAVSMMSSMPNPSAGHVRRSDLFSGFVRYEHDLGEARTPVTVFAGLGRVQRFPDYWELIKNESASSLSAFGTRPETTTQLDVGALWRNGLLEASVSLFLANIDDYVLVQSNYTKASGAMGTRSATITRSVNAATQGGEAAVTWRITKHWQAETSVSCVFGENTTDSVPLAQTPPLESRIGLAYVTPSWSLGGLLRGVDSQRRVAINQGNIVGQDIGPSSGFTVASLNASRRIGQRFRLSGGVDNVFNKTYAEHISRAGGMVSGFIQTTRVNEAGRTIWAKLDASF